MCLRASDPAGHHGLDIMGWTSWMGWTVEVLWAAARVSWGFPHIWPDRRRSRFRRSSFHRRCLPAYRIVDCGVLNTSAGMPSAASRMGVEALPGAFPGKGTGIAENPVKSPI